jgi:dephospho-CoA kinase
MKEYEIAQRVAAQATDAQRASISDVVIENNGSLDDLTAQVNEIWSKYLLPKANAMAGQ